MKNIAVLLPYDYQLLSVASILDVLETANSICMAKQEECPFKIELFQDPGQIEQSGRYFHQHAVRSIRSAWKADMVLIPGFTTHDIRATVARNAVFVPWLQKQFRAGAEMASFCTGAYLFAATGLLDRKLATTHVDACPDLIVSYPSVFVKPGRTLTVDGRCYTSGGGTTAFHLLIFLVQKFCGTGLAVKISKTFSIDLDRHQQSYFSTFRPDYSHNDDMVRQVQQRLETGFLNISTIEEVTKDLPASRRNIVRRFKQVTGIPPIAYLQNIRIETAKTLLEQTDQSISEIISGTGYGDPKSFRKVFLKLVGITPLEYREKFRVK